MPPKDPYTQLTPWRQKLYLYTLRALLLWQNLPYPFRERRAIIAAHWVYDQRNPRYITTRGLIIILGAYLLPIAATLYTAAATRTLTPLFTIPLYAAALILIFRPNPTANRTTLTFA